MSSPARAWLDQWRAAVPPTLAAVVEQAVSAADDGVSDAAAALSDAAVASLRAALRIGDDRAAALHLLAADALITAALEAAARSNREFGDLAARFSADRLSTVFQEELPSERS